MDYSRQEILESYLDEIERMEVDRKNNREFMSFFGSSEGLTVLAIPDGNELFDELKEAGYSDTEAALAVRKERRKLGFGG